MASPLREHTTGMGEPSLTLVWRQLRALADESLALAADHLDLFALEARQALRNFIWVLISAMAAALMLLVAWECLVAGLVAGLMSAGLSPAWIFAGVALAHGAAALALGVLVVRRLRQRLFAATLQMLRVSGPASAATD